MQDSQIEIGKHKVKVLKTISEGGFGIVYLVENLSKTNQKLALKKVITQDEERYKLTLKELKFLQAQCTQPSNHLINYFDSKIVDEGNNRKSFYILLEFGPNGTLFDLMKTYLEKNQRFPEQEILSLFRVINEGLVELHSHNFIHCDIKIENLLFFNWQTIKLCDFGSVSKYNIDCSKLPKSEFYTYENKFEKQTTLMYRPPEMCDLYLGFKINTQVDMWMLGCVIFTLMFFKHPFHESSKLSIVNASFFWPDDSKYSEKLEYLVRNLLTPNPDLRPTAFVVRDILSNWDNLKRIELNHLAESIRSESIAKKQLHFGSTPSPKLLNHMEVLHQGGSAITSKDNFDFTGLDKWSKNGSTNKLKPQMSKPVNEKLNNFNFMNFNFGGQSHSVRSQNLDNHSHDLLPPKSPSQNALFDFDLGDVTQQNQIKEPIPNVHFDAFSLLEVQPQLDVLENQIKMSNQNDFDLFFMKPQIKEKNETEAKMIDEFDIFNIDLNAKN